MEPRSERSRPSHNELLEIRGRSNILFVTVATKERVPILANKAVHQALRQAWREANHWCVGRYVLMPDHIHLFCAPATHPPTSLRAWVKYWKRLVSQSGTLPNKVGVWQQDCWDTQIRTGAHYTEKWDYIRQNPVRAKLVENANTWPFTGEITTLDWRDP
jgi:REP element-mobilizing transposase RayT